VRSGFTVPGSTPQPDTRLPASERPRHNSLPDTRWGTRLACQDGPTPLPRPGSAPAARELFPDDLATKPRFLCFLFFVLQAREPGWQDQSLWQ